MRKKIIMDEGRWLLEAITEEYETICSHSEKIPKIETDILMENVRKFYENLRILQRLDDPHITDEHAPKPGITGQQPVVKVVEKPVETRKLSVQPAPKPSEPMVKRPESPATAKRAVKHPEIDLFAEQEQAHTMKLQDARERAFTPKIPGSRIDNLKMAIPINDKFMYINDLFDGNLREYNETIEALNGFKTLDQAAEYLDLMKRKNFWNTGSTAFLKLKELVERRF